MPTNGSPLPAGFLRADGPRLIDGAGNPVRLRGAGLGNWLLPEGYMWRFPAAADRPRRIRKMIRELLGEDDAKAFWEEYHDSYVTETDVRLMADWGFNSVRLPINSSYVLAEDEESLDEKAMARIDRFIAWCRRYGLYVILDLHGAPGGQTGTNIDDSVDDLPRLFMDAGHRERTIALWRSLAKRYAGEWTVGGYDLLNEPLPEWFAEHNPKVMPLYKDIIRAVREVDPHHMIILEGVHWATDWSIFTEILDDNLMLQFHKYWNNPDAESLDTYLEMRDRWQVPLYMGEGGENNTDWYAGAFRMFEDLDISWNFWSWKKLDTGNSPVSIPKPDGWDRLTAYLNGGEKPGRDTAAGILRAYLDRLPTARCDLRPEVIRSLLRQPPVRIPAIFYSYEGPDRGFGPGTGPVQDAPFRRRDGHAFGFVTGRRTKPHFQHGAGEDWADDDRMYLILPAGRWAAYDFDFGDPGTGSDFELTVRHIGPGRFRISPENGETPTEVTSDDEWRDTSLTFRRTGEETSGRFVLESLDGSVGLERLVIRPVGDRRV